MQPESLAGRAISGQPWVSESAANDHRSTATVPHPNPASRHPLGWVPCGGKFCNKKLLVAFSAHSGLRLLAVQCTQSSDDLWYCRSASLRLAVWRVWLTVSMESDSDYSMEGEEGYGTLTVATLGDSRRIHSRKTETLVARPARPPPHHPRPLSPGRARLPPTHGPGPLGRSWASRAAAKISTFHAQR